MRGDKKDPVHKNDDRCWISCEDDAMNPSHPCISFPMKVDDSAVFRTDMTIEQLELWKVYQENWCEHKPSVTISVKEHE